MGIYEPIRDAAGGIIGLKKRDEREPLFASVLRESMVAVGAEMAAAPSEEEHARPLPTARQVAGGATLIILFALALGIVLRQPASVAVRPLALPTAVMGTLAPIPPTTAPTPALRMIVAFAAPDGAVLGPIPAAAGTPIARYGSAWVQLDAGPTSGKVWVRVGDLPGLDSAPLASLPNLEPPTAVPIVVQPPPAVIVAPVAQPTIAPAHGRMSSKAPAPTRVTIQQIR